MANREKQRQDGGLESRLGGSQLTLDDWEHTVSTERNAGPKTPSGARSVDPQGSAGAHAAGARNAAAELLDTPGALLTRTHLRELGLERRAVDAVFRALPVVALPGYSRPMIRVEQYLELVEQFTYRDDRVRPIARAS